MKFLSLLLLLALPSLTHAMAITEQGLPKHKLEISINLTNATQVEQEIQKIIHRDLAARTVSIVVAGDLAGYGLNETISFNDKAGFDAVHNRVHERALYEVKSPRDVATGQASGKTMWRDLESTEDGLESLEVGGISFRKSRVKDVVSNAQKMKNGTVKFFNLVIKVVDPTEELEAAARKGWDGTIKGNRELTLKVLIMSDTGEILSSFPAIGVIEDVIQSEKKGLNAVNVK
jgi:hypothetical protein